jgi:hypothetical protein
MKKLLPSAVVISILVVFQLAHSVFASSYYYYFVERILGSNHLLVSGSGSEHLIEYDYNCYSDDFLEGGQVLIDAAYSPLAYSNTILVDGLFGQTKQCNITDAEQVNLKRYFVESVIDGEDKIIVSESRSGSRFLLEYGIGCLSMWRYEGKYIDIDVGGSFLNGISDQIYLFDGDDNCKVWDADEISSISGGTTSSSTAGSVALEALLNSLNNSNEGTSQQYSCPSNSTLVGTQCQCNEGYVTSASSCTTLTDRCQSTYGQYSYGRDGSCYCDSGYKWNANQTACVPIICGLNSFLSSNSCECSTDYVMRNGSCISHTQDCQNSYGSNIIGTSGEQFGTSSCQCVDGFQWNASASACVAVLQVSPVELQPIEEKTPPDESALSSNEAIAASSLIKGNLPAVYYLAKNGKRYVFPSSSVYFSWYRDFSEVETLSDAKLAAIPIGGNVTYRPGFRMVKITTDPKVYAVSRGGVLRHVATEEVAKSIFGSDWNKQIDDIPDAFFVNYTVGSQINSAADYDKDTEMVTASTVETDKSL